MITPAYAVNLGLFTQKISVEAQNIDGLVLETYSMASASFLLWDSLTRV